MLNLTDESSDVSRTNQLVIQDTDDVVAEKLYQYLLKRGKGIETFPLSEIYRDGGPTTDYASRDQRIRQKVKKRMIDYGQPVEAKNIQYFLAQASFGWKDPWQFSQKVLQYAHQPQEDHTGPHEENDQRIRQIDSALKPASPCIVPQ